jgi:hypothetical protein
MTHDAGYILSYVIVIVHSNSGKKKDIKGDIIQAEIEVQKPTLRYNQSKKQPPKIPSSTCLVII